MAWNITQFADGESPRSDGEGRGSRRGTESRYVEIDDDWQGPPVALGVNIDGRDEDVLRAAFEGTGWKLCVAPSLQEGLTKLNRELVRAVFGPSQKCAEWRSILENAAPDARLIMVASFQELTWLRDEAPDWVFDVLATPISEAEAKQVCGFLTEAARGASNGE